MSTNSVSLSGIKYRQQLSFQIANSFHGYVQLILRYNAFLY